MMNRKKNILASTIAFFVGIGAVQGLAAEEVGDSSLGDRLMDEVVVTASKRETSLQDTSIAISVLSEDTIVKRGLIDMNDYLATIPGASYIETRPRDKRVIFRGLSNGPSDVQAVSSIYIGEMPMSSAVNTFNINLVDIERIEVIKGAQGTLYGSSAIGGLIRNVPTAPNLQQVEGKISVDASSQVKSSDYNHSISGVFNIPLIDNEMALRVAAYRFENAGYVDSISSPASESVAAATGATVIQKDDINSSLVEGARASLLWQSTDDLTFSLMLGTQKDDVDGSTFVPLSSNKYETPHLNSLSPESVSTDYINFTVEYDMGWASILSSTSKLDNKTTTTFNNYPPASLDPVSGPVGGSDNFSTSLKSEEIRLTTQWDGPWQVLGGLYYEDAFLESGGLTSWIGDIALNPFGSKDLQEIDLITDYQQKAFFGEVSYQFNDMWLLTLGGRHFEYDRVDTVTFNTALLFVAPDVREDVGQRGQTYKANLAFTPNEDVLIYAQWSEGFRLGKGQVIPPADLCDFPDGTKLTSKIEPDTTNNIELGAKFSALDNSLTINTAIFRTEWDNLPTPIVSTSSTCFDRIVNNIGSAESQGIEMDINYHLSDDWQLSLGASYIDTKRVEVRTPLIEGEPLPYAPRSNAILGLQYNFTANGFNSYVRTDIAYVGEYESAPAWLALIGIDQSGGDYTNVNLRFGMTIEQWNLAIYAKNLTNNDELLVHANGIGEGKVGVRSRPRQVGLTFSYSF